ncbi:MAG TPA: type I DNA topoisomerase [Patescibacteria group bacterium]|nr:type I DNA topoisomerase [Patescibacteria group bacterium]
MPKNLVIVESPAKAKTIEKYLGKDYSVKSSFGHIRDLPKKGLNIDIEHDFTPTYAVSDDKKKVVAELKKAAASATTIWLASDEDREGEAIAWHLAQALGLSKTKTKRIVFHEITKTAIENAIEHPRTIDINLVDAQQARRVLDRLVGYELSPVLWKKVRTGLSAGRVQSVAVRLIVEREREIRAHQAASSYKVTAVFEAGKDKLPAELSAKLATKAAAKSFLEACADETFTVKSVDKKPGSRSPSAPFTTSTLQQEASRRLGFSVKQTMTLAQRLYESGHITYMRTDSTTLSGLALKASEAYITKQLGKQYHKQRQYQTKVSGAQEAHEAIRPTNFDVLSAGEDSGQEKLYKLIWQRALASQMADAKIDRTEIVINLSKRPETFMAKGEILIFDGFLKVYGGGKDDVIVPNITVGQKLELDQLLATETFSRSAARYSEAALVKKLEELGIGRPSTYAPTISTIQTRGYVEKSDLEGTERCYQVLTLKGKEVTEETQIEITGADKNKLLPTDTAEVTTDFLVKYFGEVLDYDFTATVEQDFDNIAEGKQQWVAMIKKFYGGFHPLIGKADNVSREEAQQARELGKDPTSGKPIMARYGRYGAMLQRGEASDDDKPDFAQLPEKASLETVTLEQALEMFKLPRIVGKTDDNEEIVANIGRFGPYIKVGKLFVSIKPHDPMKITEDEARKLYQEKLDKEAAKHIQTFKGGLQVLNGMYGPYVTDGKKNAKIPKETDPAKLTEAEAKKLLAEAPAKGKRNFRRRKKA